MDKRIVIIENHYIAPATIRYDLVNALYKEGYTITILTKLDDSFEKSKFENDIHFIDVGYSSLNPITAVVYCWKLYKNLKKISPTVCLTFTIRPAIWGNIVTRLLGIKTISTITGTGQLFENKTPTYKFARWIYSWVLKKTKLVIFPNYDDLNSFVARKYISTTQAVRVPGSGINYNNFTPQIRTKNLDENFHFLFIGRFVKDKGVLEYVAAAKYFKENNKKVVFHLLGMLWEMNEKKFGVTKEELNTWIENDWVIYHKETFDVKSYIANVDCIVLPSYREGLSNVLLEAASMEKPIVTTNVTGCKDIVEQNYNGLLCEAKNENDLIEKLQTMIDLPKEKVDSFGKNGRKKVIAEFAKEKVLAIYLDAIKKVIHE